MRKFLFAAQFVLFILFNFFLLLTILEVTGTESFFTKFDREIPVYNGVENYDPSLARLNSMEKVEDYCDSLYTAEAAVNKNLNFEHDYPLVVSDVVRRKFYHGYSSYSYTNNFMAVLLEPMITKKWISAIVVPDDIVKFPNAACSQQSIVMMEVLKKKGFHTRMVGFDGGDKYGGHFCFEVFYSGRWHFFDPDQEPDADLLAAYDRPSIDFLVQKPDLLVAAYNRMDEKKVRGMFPAYFYGKVDRFEAPRALVYQKVTKFLSYTLWIILLVAFIVVRRRYLRLINPYNVWNSRFSFPSLTGKGSFTYYSKNRA